MRHALIAGAGIGGLACGIALARRGWSVEIFEQAPALSEIGAGVQLGPNACRVLAAWDLLAPAQVRAFEPRALVTRDWRSGRELSRMPLGEEARRRWGAPYLQLHRADLQEVLAGRIGELDTVQLHLDHTVGRLEPEHGRLHCGAQAFSGDLIVGADGIRSRVRQALFGDGVVHYTGQCAWRLMLPAEILPAGLVPPTACLWMGPGKHLVHYFVRGGELVNVVGVVEQARWAGDSWTEPAPFDELCADFADAHADVRRLVGAAEDGPCYRWALHDMPPLTAWSRGRVTLLGDACHATLPFLAQGAALAIEDAAVLAAVLDAGRDQPAALRRYEQLRQPRTAWVQQASRRNARIFHLRGPAAAARNLALASGLAGPRGLAQRLYGFDASAAS